MSEYDPINNPASTPENPSAENGHGGQEAMPSNRPDPDPISELATFDPNSQDNNPDRPQLASQPGSKPGFGPDEITPPQLEGNPELEINPREVRPDAGSNTSSAASSTSP